MTPQDPVVCSGEPEEVGRCQGEGLGELVRRSPSILRELEAFRLARPWCLPFFAFLWLARRKAAAEWRNKLAEREPAMAARVLGIAQGSDVREDEVQLLNIVEPILSDLRQTSAPLGGCSSVAIRGRCSAGETPVIACNFDYLPLVQPYYVLREMRPTGGLRSLEFTVAPLAGAVDGLNEAGLAITCNYAYVVDDPDPGATPTMAVSAMLGACESVVQAEAYLNTHKTWGGAILMLADASGDIASIELSNTRRGVHRPVDGADWQYHTNRFREGEMRTVELARDTHYADGSPAALRGVRVHESAEERDARLGEALPAARGLDLDGLQRLLSDHGPDGKPSGNSVCMHGTYWFTTASLQLLPRERRMRVAFDTACTARYREFGL